MAGTYYSENKILEQLFGAVAIGAPANWYIGLSTNTPSEASGSAVEPTGIGSYARVQVPNNSTYFNTASTGQVTNKLAITFPESTASWGTITYVLFYDAPTGDNLWFYQLLPVSRTVAINTTVYFSAGALILSNRN